MLLRPLMIPNIILGSNLHETLIFHSYIRNFSSHNNFNNNINNNNNNNNNNNRRRRRIIEIIKCSSCLKHYDFSKTIKSGEDMKKITIPRNKIDMSFCCSSGPGGQNVNKVNTKAELRFCIGTADWLSEEVKEQLRKQQGNKINSKDELIIQASVHRTQHQNLELAFQKMQEIVNRACIIPKPRIIREGRTEKGDRERLLDKKAQSLRKERRQRSKNSFDDF